MDDWFKGTCCATELIEWSVGDMVNDGAQAFVRCWDRPMLICG